MHWKYTLIEVYTSARSGCLAVCRAITKHLSRKCQTSVKHVLLSESFMENLVGPMVSLAGWTLPVVDRIVHLRAKLCFGRL